MKVLFTICGRAGSKGIKNKNIRNFVGKPLPFYTISAIDLYLKKNRDIDYDIVINSDSEVLLELMAGNGMRTVDTIMRDPSLAKDNVGKIDVISNCLSIMEQRKNTKYDAVVDLDITSPLRKVCDIENLLRLHFEKKPDVTTSVVPARRNPYFNQVMRTEKGVRKVIESNYTARQQAPQIFDMNASLYAYSPDYLRSGKGVLEGYCEVIEMYDTGILDLDHVNDFELMEVIAEYLYKTYPEFAEIRDNIQDRSEMRETLDEKEISEENLESFIADNMKRSGEKYKLITNVVCLDCNAILDQNAKICPNCGSKNLAGMFTDGKR